VNPAAPAEPGPAARALGAAALGLSCAAVLATVLGRRRQPGLQAPLQAAPRPPPAPPPRPGNAEARAAGQLYLSAAMLAASVLSDSALEHYRGGFENPGMFAPLASAALALGVAGRASRRPARPASPLPFGAACAVGAAGLGFHAYNVLRRPGGLSWANLFYAAPLGAPAALSLAGLLGLAAREVGRGAPALARLPRGRALGLLAAAGLAGTSLEAALLHFRGAYHNPAMWLPVGLPPVGGALLAASTVRTPDASPRLARLARALLAATAWLGVAGVALHARGIARQMGGWRNWSQNLLSGPPLPAPPSFTALALAGRAALDLGPSPRHAREAA
jgi:hypothetical protein